MKKALPLIVILISLSLLGLILLQVSWLNNLLEIRQGQLYSKFSNASARVAIDLSKGNGNMPIIKVPKRLGFGRFNPDISRLIKPPLVGERYSLTNIQAKLQEAFENEDIHNIKFEFGVIDGNSDLEMYSKNFLNEVYDTLNNKQTMVAIGRGISTTSPLVSRPSVEGVVPPAPKVSSMADTVCQPSEANNPMAGCSTSWSSV